MSSSSVNGADVVYEIGPGTGIITRKLAQVAKKVIAVEQDPTLVHKLKNTFKRKPNVEIYQADCRDFEVTEIPYKMFSNIPFNITSNVVRNILFGDNPPVEAYLIMQKEAARRFSGTPNESQISVLTKPFFELGIVKDIMRQDFVPVPGVNVVLFHAKKRDGTLVDRGHLHLYEKFVTYGFGSWKKDLKTAYKRIFTYKQWKIMAKDIGFPLNVTPTQLTFEQWLSIFQCFLRLVSEEKKVIVY